MALMLPLMCFLYYYSIVAFRNYLMILTAVDNFQVSLQERKSIQGPLDMVYNVIAIEEIHKCKRNDT